MNNKDLSRELIVTLLQRQIDELMLMTEGFMDMETYPEAIIQLAKLKNVEIREYLDLLDELPKTINPAMTDVLVNTPVIDNNEIHLNQGEINTEESIPEVNIDENNHTELIINDTKIEDIVAENIVQKTMEEEIPSEVISEEIKEVEENIVFDSEEEKEEEEEVDEEDEEDEDEDEDVEDNLIISENEKPETEPEIVVEESPKTTLGEKLAASTMTRNEMHTPTESSILSNISNTKITDIRQAISIGDRFRFQRELFRGNGEDMNKTLNYINQLATMHEVESFLKSKYNWSADIAAVEDFFQIIKRKF